MLYDVESLKKALSKCPDLMTDIEKAFVAYTKGETIVPPVGFLNLEQPEGAVFIKYGCIKGDDNFAIKVFTAFNDNVKENLPATSGMILVFSAKTGFIKAILDDKGYLTGVRTALAGAIAAKYMAPKAVKAIGIIGTGNQAELQLVYLKNVTDCKKVYVYGRNAVKAAAYAEKMQAAGYDVTVAATAAEVAANCNLIVTTTASTAPHLFGADIQPGTHITAMGSDAPGKQELDATVLGKADIVVADSISQCFECGECAPAAQAGLLKEADVVELGNVILAGKCRENEEQITVCDLTGIAVQDIAIASAVLSGL